jgi:hypothetical protein
MPMLGNVLYITSWQEGHGWDFLIKFHVGVAIDLLSPPDILQVWGHSRNRLHHRHKTGQGRYA